MDIAAGVLTHNAFKHERVDLLKATLRSLAAQDVPVYVVDNGSEDGTAELVRKLDGTCLDDPVTTCGHGMNAVCGILADSGAEVCIFSNDDISWRPGAAQRLLRFFRAAPDDLILVGGILEDDYPWNTPREKVTYGGEDALVRATAPGGAWCFRGKDWDTIGPVPASPGWDDVPTCQRLERNGYRVAQMDLAEHLGRFRSTWGNNSELFGKPLDRAAWGLDAEANL